MSAIHTEERHDTPVCVSVQVCGVRGGCACDDGMPDVVLLQLADDLLRIEQRSIRCIVVQVGIKQSLSKQRFSIDTSRQQYNQAGKYQFVVHNRGKITAKRGQSPYYFK